MSVPFPMQPQQHVLFFDFLVAILTGMRWCLLVVLICISPMIGDGEQFFMFAGHMVCFILFYLFIFF